MTETIPQGIPQDNTRRAFTFGYSEETINSMPEYTKSQTLLMQLRKDYCKNNSAELARRISKDATYVHRLFYPVGKKGGKGIGLEIMQACSDAFTLPPGFWDGVGLNAPPLETETATVKVMEDRRVYHTKILTINYDEWVEAAIKILSELDSL